MKFFLHLFTGCLQFQFSNLKLNIIIISSIKQLTKQVKMRFIHRLNNNFSTLNAQFLFNKNRNAVRFQSQNLAWNFEQLNYQGYGLIKGLTSLNFKSADNFLIRTPASQQAEAYITKIGTAGIGAKLFVSKANTPAELDRQLQENNISCLVFQPNVLLENNKLIDTLNGLAPELASQVLGSPLKLSKYPNLRTLIQTNFYSFPGVYKFRAVMNYASDRFFKVDNVNAEPVALPVSNNTIIITDPANDFAFRAGVLNSLVNGRYVHVVEAGHVASICAQVYQNKVDLIATSDVTVDPSVRVIVQRGSKILSSHQNRVQL